MSGVTVFVCTSCGAKEGKISRGNGRELYERLIQTGAHDVHIEPVSCLSNCDRGVSVALSAQGKFGWVFGERGHGDEDVALILRAAQDYRDSPDGFIAKSSRPKPVIGRVPPPDFSRNP